MISAFNACSTDSISLLSPEDSVAEQ